MKSRVGLLIVVVTLSSVFLACCRGGGGSNEGVSTVVSSSPGFAAGDIAGTWGLVNADFVSPTSGSMDVGGNGSVTGGSYTEAGVGSGTFTGGTLSVNTGGAVSGRATLSDGRTLTLSDGQMSLDKDLFVYAAVDSLNAAQSAVLVRVSGAYATADLQGTWTWGSSTHYGTILVDSSGFVTSGTYTHVGVGSGLITGGLFTISAQGSITGSFTTDEPVTYTVQVPGASMNSDKSFICSVFTYPPSGKLGVIAVKQGGSFTPGTDIAGAWMFIMSASQGNDVLYGSINIDSAGTVTGGSVTEIGVGSATFVGGVLSLSTGGAVTGSALTSSGKTYTILGQSGQMNVGKTVLMFVSEDSSNGKTGVTAMVKMP